MLCFLEGMNIFHSFHTDTENNPDVMRFRLSLPRLTVFLKSPHCLLIYYSQDNRRVIVIFEMPLKADSNRKAAIQTGESDVWTRNKRYLWSALQKLMQHFSAFPLHSCYETNLLQIPHFSGNIKLHRIIFSTALCLWMK